MESIYSGSCCFNQSLSCNVKITSICLLVEKAQMPKLKAKIGEVLQDNVFKETMWSTTGIVQVSEHKHKLLTEVMWAEKLVEVGHL